MNATLSEIKDTLQNNLTILKEYYPHVYSIIEGDLSSCSIAFSDPENKMLNITLGQKQISISAQQREVALSKIAKAETNEPTYLIVGLGVGDELLKLFDTTQLPVPELPYYKLPIYVVEPEPLMLIATMWLHDMRELFESQRIQWFIGENSPTELLEHFQSRQQAIHPTHFISHWYSDEHPVVSASRQNIYEASNKTNAAIYQLKIKINKYYNNITQDDWHDIFASKKRPLRIMGWTSRFTTFLQYCTRDLLAGFEELGHETLMHIEESDISRTTQQDTLATINEFKPDLLIIIDHFRHEYAFLPKNLPFVNWIQDLLPNITNPGSGSFNPLDFTYVFAPQWVDTLKNIPAYSDHKIDVLHLGINPNTYYPIENTEKTFDVLYVSHLIPTEQTLRPLVNSAYDFEVNQVEAALLDSGIISYEQLLLVYKLTAKTLDELFIEDLWEYHRNTSTRESNILHILSKLEIPTQKPIVEHFLKSKRIMNDIVFSIKTRPLSALIKQGIDVRIYGNNWDFHTDFHDNAQGPITNGPPLNLLMNQARVCLNNSSGVSLHMFALEILGSGSFMLSRDIPQDISDIRKFLTEDKDVFFFKNEIDIAKKVSYWLEHKTERKQVSNRAHIKALSIFNYKNIAKTIQTSIQERLSSL